MNNDILTAENAVLGACLCDNTGALFRAALAVLHEADLAGDLNRCILHAARELDAEGKTPDAPTVRDRVHREDVNNEYLVRLMDIACAGATLDQNIATIKRATQLRTLSQIGENIAARARNGDEPSSITGDAAKALDELAANSTGGLIDSTTAAVDFYQFYESITNGRSVYVSTGIDRLDSLLGGGMMDSGLYIMAARPGCGKTALALQVADHVAQNVGGVLFVTLEMSKNQLTTRRIARETGIPSNRLMVGKITDSEMMRTTQCLKQLNNYPFFFNKQECCSVNDVRALARQMKNLRLVVVDYLGLLKPEGRKNSRYDEITAISGDLKALARYLDVPVLCLAQLNRASELRQDKKPSLADLRDSGAIEQDADGVLLLHRPDMHAAGSLQNKLATVECTLAKHRHGPVGAITLVLKLETGKFIGTAPTEGRSKRV